MRGTFSSSGNLFDFGRKSRNRSFFTYNPRQSRAVRRFGESFLQPAKSGGGCVFFKYCASTSVANQFGDAGLTIDNTAFAQGHRLQTSQRQGIIHRRQKKHIRRADKLEGASCHPHQ